MTSSRDAILAKLRRANPFEDAPPRPKSYLQVTIQEDVSPDALIERFTAELTRLLGSPMVVTGDDEARSTIIELLKKHETKSMLAWDFAHIPVEGLEAAIRAQGIEIMQPDSRDEFRTETLFAAESAQVGLTGVDAAVANTGSMVVVTGKGKGRIPTVLPPVHIAVIRLDQLLPSLEAWLAKQREIDPKLSTITDHANVCFITGPSRTGDIEMELILGVHGPGIVYGIIKK